MFDDARFYSKLAEDSRCFGRVRSDESHMYLLISALDFDDDLLAAMDRGEDYLID